MLLPSYFFYWAYSSSKAQLAKPRQPTTRSQRSKALKRAKTTISMGKMIAYQWGILTQPKKLRKEEGGEFIICRQLKHSGQQTRERLMAVNSRLLAEECPRCSAKTLYTLILKMAFATEWATYAVSRTLSTQEAIPDQPNSLRRLAGWRKDAKAASSAKKRKAAMRVVSMKVMVQYIFLLRQLLWRQLSVTPLSSSTNSSSWLAQALFSRARFLTILCRSAVDFFLSASAFYESSPLQLWNLKCKWMRASTSLRSKASRAVSLSSIWRMVNIYQRIVSCSAFRASAWRWHTFTIDLQSRRWKHSLGSDSKPYPIRTVTRVRPKTLTNVANTPGS